jgi:nucleoside-diphosphate-sugar epimerase
MKQVIVITGASSGFGALTARALAHAGHIVYASMRDTEGRNAPQAAAVKAYAAEHGVTLLPLELDVTSDALTTAAIDAILGAQGRLDVVIHNAGHMAFGPAEAFTPEQLAELYDVTLKGLAALEPPDADVAQVVEAIVDVVNTPFGKRPFRVHVDPSEDGAEVVNRMADRVRAELLRRIGLADLLKPAVR